MRNGRGELGAYARGAAQAGLRLRTEGRARRRLCRSAAGRRRLPRRRSTRRCRGRAPGDGKPPPAPAATTKRRSSWPEAAIARRRRGRAPRPSRPGHGPARVAQAKGGEYEDGLETVRAGLALAIEHDLTPVAAELYQRLSLVLYDAADYRRAEEALDTALDLCQAERRRGHRGRLRHLPRLRPARARRMVAGRGALAAADRATDRAVWVAEGLVGAIHAFRRAARIRPATAVLLPRRRLRGRPLQHVHGHDDGARLGRRRRGCHDEAAEHCRSLLARWEESEDHHYAVWGLRWAAVVLRPRRRPRRRPCLRRGADPMAADGGHADALAALAQAIGEIALLDGDAGDGGRAARAGGRAAPRAWGSRSSGPRSSSGPASRWPPRASASSGIERLCDAYRTARKLGAQPLATEAAGEVAALGDSVAAAARAPRRRRDADVAADPARARGSSPRRRSAAPTARSPRSSSSARARSTCTCATSSASSTAARGSRPSTAPVSSSCSG